MIFSILSQSPATCGFPPIKIHRKRPIHRKLPTSRPRTQVDPELWAVNSTVTWSVPGKVIEKNSCWICYGKWSIYNPFNYRFYKWSIYNPFIDFYSWSTRKKYKNPKKSKEKNTWTLPGLTFQPPLVFQQSRWRVDRSDSCHGTRGIPTSVARWSLTVSKEVSKNPKIQKHDLKTYFPQISLPKKPSKRPPRSPQVAPTQLDHSCRLSQARPEKWTRDFQRPGRVKSGKSPKTRRVIAGKIIKLNGGYSWENMGTSLN